MPVARARPPDADQPAVFRLAVDAYHRQILWPDATQVIAPLLLPTLEVRLDEIW